MSDECYRGKSVDLISKGSIGEEFELFVRKYGLRWHDE